MAQATRFRQRCAAELAPNDYIHRHETVQPSHRSIVANWIYEIAATDGFGSTEAQLAMWLFDRFLSLFPSSIPCNRLQLVACAALLVATKYEATHPISLHRLEDLSDNSCKGLEITHVETIILNTVKHRLMWPTPNEWFGVQAKRDPTVMEQLVLDLGTMSYILAVQTAPLLAVSTCQQIVRLTEAPPRSRRVSLTPTVRQFGCWLRWAFAQGDNVLSAFEARCPVELDRLRDYVNADDRYVPSGSVSTQQ